MKTQINLSDFDFKLKSFNLNGYVMYEVTYTNTLTGKQFTAIVTDMTLIDATKNAKNPKIKDLENLKKICKYY